MGLRVRVRGRVRVRLGLPWLRMIPVSVVFFWP